MDEITTIDLSKFGFREREIAERLLSAWRVHGLPEDFSDDKVTIMFNTHSGCVFLTNADYQVCMLNGDKLESFYTCFNCGNEGFEEDILHKGKCTQCEEQIK